MTLERGNLFDPVLVNDLFNKVKGESSLAKLSQQEPIPFNGTKEFTFDMDNEIDIVAEGGKKSHGGITVEPVTIVPLKVEYGARVTDEFMHVDREERIGIVKGFNDGFARRLARGFDLMAFHGRSEERRVGKEGRSGVARGSCKKKGGEVRGVEATREVVVGESTT